TTSPLAGTADLYVVNNRGVRLDLAGPLWDVPGVSSVLPIIWDRVPLADLSDRSTVIVGVDLNSLARAAETAGGADVAAELGFRWEFNEPLGKVFFGLGKGALVSRLLRDGLAREGQGPTDPVRLH